MTAKPHAGLALMLVTHRMDHRERLNRSDTGIGVFGSGISFHNTADLFRVFGWFMTGAALEEALGDGNRPRAAVPCPREDAQRDFPAIMELGTGFGPE